MPLDNVLLIVTGASRGLGRAIATAFCEAMPVAHAVLVARSEQSLEEIASDIKAGFPAIAKPSFVVADLADLESLDRNLDIILPPYDTIPTQQFDRVIFVNNAGTLGHIGKAKDSPSLTEMRRNVDLNITSALWASTRVARLGISSVIVNISSLVAVQPFASLAMYSSGKAARDAYHTSMAADKTTESDANSRILSYAPGPLETDMSQELRHAKSLDESLKPAFAKQLVDPMDSARKLVQLVIKGEYTSGEHIDYFDV